LQIIGYVCVNTDFAGSARQVSSSRANRTTLKAILTVIIIWISIHSSWTNLVASVIKLIINNTSKIFALLTVKRARVAFHTCLITSHTRKITSILILAIGAVLCACHIFDHFKIAAVCSWIYFALSAL